MIFLVWKDEVLVDVYSLMVKSECIIHCSVLTLKVQIHHFESFLLLSICGALINEEKKDQLQRIHTILN